MKTELFKSIKELEKSFRGSSELGLIWKNPRNELVVLKSEDILANYNRNKEATRTNAVKPLIITEEIINSKRPISFSLNFNPSFYPTNNNYPVRLK